MTEWVMHPESYLTLVWQMLMRSIERQIAPLLTLPRLATYQYGLLAKTHLR